MGAPRRNRKKIQKPSEMWNRERIETEHRLRREYGLKSLHELWRATSEIRRVRRNVRAVLSGRISEETGKGLISRLSRYGIVKDGATLDDLLGIKPEDVLERRLQSLVYRKGMARGIKQARQLVAHGFIAVDGKRAKSPGYLVSRKEESAITYYKPIRIQEEAKASQEVGEEAAQPRPEGAAA